jgi:hypothetical protein
MQGNKHFIQTSLAALIVWVPTAASSQTIATSFEDLAHILKQGQEVVVIDTRGRETRGKVLQSLPSSLVLLEGNGLTSGRVNLVPENVREIRRLDSRANGALIGMSIGLGAGIAIISAMCADGPDCGPWAQVGIATAGVGSAVGVGVDTLIGKGGQIVFRSPQNVVRLTFSPIVERDRLRLLFSVHIAR